MPLINYEVNLNLTWSEDCVKADTAMQAAQGNNPEIRAPADVTFAVTTARLYVPVATLSTLDNTKLLQQLKTGFKRTINWNKYSCERTNQANSSNLIYLICRIFHKFNRLFVLYFENKDDKTSYSDYYVQKLEIINHKFLIDDKIFFWDSYKKQRLNIWKNYGS